MSSLSNYPLVTLTSRETQTSVSFLPATWVQDDRKDVLRLVEGTPEDLPAGTVDLAGKLEQFPPGWYDITIREQTNNTNVDPNDAVVVGVLEQGIAYLTISDVAFGENVYTTYENDQTGYTFYQG